MVAAWHTLQYLGILPVTLGRLQFYGVDLLGAALWGLTAAVWVWAVVNLWRLNPQALLFVTLLAGWNLILAVLSWLGASDFQAVLPALLLNGGILLYSLSSGFGAPSACSDPGGPHPDGEGRRAVRV